MKRRFLTAWAVFSALDLYLEWLRYVWKHPEDGWLGPARYWAQVLNAPWWGPWSALMSFYANAERWAEGQPEGQMLQLYELAHWGDYRHRYWQPGDPDDYVKEEPGSRGDTP